MGLAARKRVEREFTWSIVAMRTAALYEAVLTERMSEPLSVKSLSLASLTALSAIQSRKEWILPLVDVLIPTYGRTTGLAVVLTSLLGQTFTDFDIKEFLL